MLLEIISIFLAGTVGAVVGYLLRQAGEPPGPATRSEPHAGAANRM